MIRFGDPEELGYELPFPIVTLLISPVSPKFAERLSHRDFLGALMNLGIERSKLGDIVLRDGEAYLFAREEIAEYIKESLTRVRHTDVRVSLAECIPDGELYRTEPRRIVLNGERVDAVIAKVYNLSRDEAQRLFAGRLVFINGKENASRVASRNDTAAPVCVYHNDVVKLGLVGLGKLDTYITAESKDEAVRVALLAADSDLAAARHHHPKVLFQLLSGKIDGRMIGIFEDLIYSRAPLTARARLLRCGPRCRRRCRR